MDSLSDRKHSFEQVFRLTVGRDYMYIDFKVMERRAYEIA